MRLTQFRPLDPPSFHSEEIRCAVHSLSHSWREQEITEETETEETEGLLIRKRFRIFTPSE